jgi:hypothetical protein
MQNLVDGLGELKIEPLGKALLSARVERVVDVVADHRFAVSPRPPLTRLSAGGVLLFDPCLDVAFLVDHAAAKSEAPGSSGFVPVEPQSGNGHGGPY